MVGFVIGDEDVVVVVVDDVLDMCIGIVLCVFVCVGVSD